MTLSQPDEALTSSGLIKPVAIGVAVAGAGILPWIVMARINAQLRPDLPWAALATAVYLALFITWLNGAGPPERWKQARRKLLRLRSGQPSKQSGDDLLSTPAIIVAFVLLTAVWVALGPSEPPDLSAYPTTAYRFSVAIMGAAVSGIVEEAAFRGYMQRGLERFGVHRAILITSVIFVLVHAVHGLGTLLVLGPGIFVASWLYGWLAWRTGSIVPGMVIHSLGDFAYTYFGLLGGDHRLLFAS